MSFKESYCIKRGYLITPHVIKYLISRLYFTKVVKVTVDILDINDHTPRFHHAEEEKGGRDASITVYLSEASPEGSEISLPAATDPDSAQFGVRRYELISETSVFWLVMDDRSVELVWLNTDVRIRLTEKLDYETINLYQFTVNIKPSAFTSSH